MIHALYHTVQRIFLTCMIGRKYHPSDYRLVNFVDKQIFVCYNKLKTYANKYLKFWRLK